MSDIKQNIDEDLSRWLTDGGRPMPEEFNNGALPEDPVVDELLEPTKKKKDRKPAHKTASSPPTKGGEESFTHYVVGGVRVVLPSADASNADKVREAFAAHGIKY